MKMDLKKISEKISMMGFESLTQEEKNALKSFGTQNGIREFLSKVSIEQIVMKSEEFHALNVKKLTDEELFNALMNAISFDIDDSGSKISFLMPRGVSFPGGTKFYKIRTLDKGDDNFPLKTMSKEQDAWCYSSVAAKQGHNCCFRPDVARKVLNLLGVQVCSVNRKDDAYYYKCECILVWNNDKGVYDYYNVDSPMCRRLFPEIMAESLPLG